MAMVLRLVHDSLTCKAMVLRIIYSDIVLVCQNISTILAIYICKPLRPSACVSEIGSVQELQVVQCAILGLCSFAQSLWLWSAGCDIFWKLLPGTKHQHTSSLCTVQQHARKR